MSGTILRRTAVLIVILMLSSAVMETDAVAAAGRAGGGSVIAGDRGGGGFGAPRFEPRRFGRGYYPFGYYGGYGGYGGYGSFKQNWLTLPDAHRGGERKGAVLPKNIFILEENQTQCQLRNVHKRNEGGHRTPNRSG